MNNFSDFLLDLVEIFEKLQEERYFFFCFVCKVSNGKIKVRRKGVKKKVRFLFIVFVIWISRGGVFCWTVVKGMFFGGLGFWIYYYMWDKEDYIKGEDVIVG